MAAEQRGRLEVNTGTLGSVAGKTSKKLHGIAVSRTSLLPCLADKWLPAGHGAQLRGHQPIPSSASCGGSEVNASEAGGVSGLCVPAPHGPMENPRVYNLKNKDRSALGLLFSPSCPQCRAGAEGPAAPAYPHGLSSCSGSSSQAYNCPVAGWQCHLGLLNS